MKTNRRNYFIRYQVGADALTLESSRAANGAWSPGLDGIPPALHFAFAPNVSATDPEAFAAYHSILTDPKAAPVSVGTGPDVKGEVRYFAPGVLRLVAEVAPHKLKLDPAPESLMQAFKDASTNRWRWESIHCCVTGKDADLEPQGQQGIEILGVRGKALFCLIHIGATVAGDDVSLNLTPEQEEDEFLFDKAREAYLERAQEVVIGTTVSGEWDGDSWYLSETVPFSMRLRDTDEDTVSALIGKVDKVLAPIAGELRLMHSILDVLSGWKDQDGNPCPEGRPSAGSVSSMIG